MVLELHELGYQLVFTIPNADVRCHGGLKKGVLELTKLEYQKKWYLPNYFANSVLGPNISKMNGNGPFCPKYQS